MLTQLDLLLVHPGAAHGIYGSELATSLVAVEPPLWPRLLAGTALDQGWTVAIVDQEAEGLTAEEVAQQVKSAGPRLVVICCFGHQPSASTQQMDASCTVAAAIKEATPVTPILLIGGHPSALPERTLREEVDVDYVCVGEGPTTVHGLLAGTLPQMIPGLVWWDGDGVRINERAEAIPMAQMHGNAWHLLPMKRYRAHNWQCFGNFAARQPYASIMTSLNCPYACEFCCIAAPFGDRVYRRRDPIDVVDEIQLLHDKYGVRTIKIIDELFILNRHHVRAICQMLVERGLGAKLNIWCYGRTDGINAADLPLLRQAGIQWIALGIEAGSAAVRGAANKALRGQDDNAAIKATVETIRSFGINVIGNFIFGLRTDTLETMQQTLDLAIECLPDFANFYACHAYPGSPLYTRALAEEWTLPDSWKGYSQHNYWCRPLDTEHVDAVTVLCFRDEAFVQYFTDPAYLAMITAKFGAATAEHVRAMTTYRLKRRLLGDAP